MIRLFKSHNTLLRIFLLFLCAAGSTAHSQTVNLDVLMNDKKIGDITAAKTAKGKTVNATLSSKVNVTMIFQVHVESTIASEYREGKLVKAEAERISNIKSENKKSVVVWDGSQYNITRDGVSTTQKDPVSFGVLDLYFTEPKGITQAFSELGGIYMPVTSLNDHRYQLQINENKKDVFVYDNSGKLLQVETVIAMNKVIFKTKQ